MPDINAQVVNANGAISDSNPLQVAIIPAKATPQTLFGGAIAASVTEANATVIDMRKFTKGELSALVNSGTGTFSCAFYTSEVATGTFKLLHQEKKDGSGYQVKPALVTTTESSLAYEINGIRGNYLKIVPTLTGTANVTFKFTPSV